MAQLQLEPPEPFNFRAPDDWPRWKRRFEHFRIASGLQGRSQIQQVSTLLYCLGEEAEGVLTSTNVTADERKVYDTVVGKFDAFFKVRRNVIFERARFNRRNQLDGEPAEQYIMELYRLAESCDYGDLKDEMIRDRLVVGIRDAVLSQLLQLDADLTLETAKKKIRQREAVGEQNKELKGATEGDISLEAVLYHRRSQPSGSTTKPRLKQPWKHQKQCTRCGKGQHPKDKCPAKEATCHRCLRKGHFGAQCFSKSIAELSNDSYMDVAFLDTVSSMSFPQESAWLTKVTLCGHDTVFKLDTGAEVTAVSQETHQRLGKPPLQTPEKLLCGPSGQPLPVMGQFLGQLTRKEQVSQQKVCVIKGLQTNLLGLPAITALNLAARVDSANCKTNNHQRLPKVFGGLENLEEFKTRLKPDSSQYIPQPLQPKGMQELEPIGVIPKVEEPGQYSWPD